jgi:hypothetical protein
VSAVTAQAESALAMLEERGAGKHDAVKRDAVTLCACHLCEARLAITSLLSGASEVERARQGAIEECTAVCEAWADSKDAGDGLAFMQQSHARTLAARIRAIGPAAHPREANEKPKTTAIMSALAAMVRHACPESGADNHREAVAAHDHFVHLVAAAKREVDAIHGRPSALAAGRGDAAGASPVADDAVVIVRWRRDGWPDGETTWDALRDQRPEITDGEGARIVAAGFLYEHDGGTTVQLRSALALPGGAR